MNLIQILKALCHIVHCQYLPVVVQLSMLSNLAQISKSTTRICCELAEKKLQITSCVVHLLYRLSIFCVFVVQLVVQQIHKRSKRVEFVRAVMMMMMMNE